MPKAVKVTSKAATSEVLEITIRLQPNQARILEIMAARYSDVSAEAMASIIVKNEVNSIFRQTSGIGMMDRAWLKGVGL